MIKFTDYQDNPLAPRFYVSKIGGIYRAEDHLIQVTFTDSAANARGTFQDIACGHVFFRTARVWRDAYSAFDFAVDAFQRGLIGNDGPDRIQ
jgi:hypothetical protein